MLACQRHGALHCRKKLTEDGFAASTISPATQKQPALTARESEIVAPKGGSEGQKEEI